MKGIELKTKRESKGWSQEKLAEIAGVTKRTVINWEQSEILSDSKVKLLQSVFNDVGERNTAYSKNLSNKEINETIKKLETIEDVSYFIVDYEKELKNDSTFSLWLKTKVQEGVIKVLSSDLK